ncbi:hypothetical protein ACIPZF_02175 [Pseudomonas sp. NPDC089752]|uniref:hypothetical protein n=1 Tax=Pseudomonas sp. NPDC089752 TaxID=3364472 RepID=UPI00381D6A95
MSKPHAFQLAYTIKPHKKIHESQADAARYHMRHHMGWTPHETIQTTLLGHIPLASGTNEQKRNEARNVMRKQIKEAFKTLEVDHLISFTGSLMVNDLEDAIEVEIP